MQSTMPPQTSSNGHSNSMNSTMHSYPSENGTNGNSVATVPSTSANDAVDSVLEHITDWRSFDVFRLDAASNGRPLQLVTLRLLQSLGLVQRLQLSVDRLSAFLAAVEAQYDPQPYHNSTHAADVVQALGSMMVADCWATQLPDVEALVLIIAAAVHDLGHPGVNNDFHMRSNSDAAQAYAANGSINENGHAEMAMRTLESDALDFLKPLGADGRATFTKLLRILILSTDMAHHKGLVERFTAAVQSHGTGLSSWPDEDRQCALCMLLHCADISNPARPLARCQEWGRRVQEELFGQGDRERAMGLSVTPACDRQAATPARSQAFFIRRVMQPCIATLETLAPRFVSQVMPFVEKTLLHWEAAIASSQQQTESNGKPIAAVAAMSASADANGGNSLLLDRGRRSSSGDIAAFAP